MTDVALPKIGAPATRALASIGITRLEQVANHGEKELLALHGFGRRALDILRVALAERGQSLAADTDVVLQPRVLEPAALRVRRPD